MNNLENLLEINDTLNDLIVTELENLSLDDLQELQESGTLNSLLEYLEEDTNNTLSYISKKRMDEIFKNSGIYKKKKKPLVTNDYSNADNQRRPSVGTTPSYKKPRSRTKQRRPGITTLPNIGNQKPKPLPMPNTQNRKPKIKKY